MLSLEVRVEEVGEVHMLPYADLSRAVYGDESPIANPQHLRWKFLHKPGRRARGVHLYAGGAIVGRVVAQPWEFVHSGGVALAAYIVDFVVHPGYRGMRPLLELWHGLRTLRGDFDFILITPNAAGVVVWKQFAKVTERFALGVYAAALRPVQLAAKRGIHLPGVIARLADRVFGFLLASIAGMSVPGRMRIDDRWPPDSELDELFASQPAARVVRGLRTSAILRWRFQQSPVVRYDVSFLRADRRLVGYVVTRRLVYLGYDVRFIVDAFSSPDVTRRDWSQVGWMLLKDELVHETELLMIVATTVASGAMSKLATLPFLPIPTRFAPQTVPLFADWWSDPRFDISKDTFALTLADCDMI